MKTMLFHRIFLSIVLLHQALVHPVSLVYNLKIRRSFSAHHFLHREHEFLWLCSAVPVVYLRKRHIVAPQLHENIFEKTFFGGSLFNVRCLAPKEWWFELTGGVARQSDKLHGTDVAGTKNVTISHTGGDDIVLTAGKNVFLHHDKCQLVFYGLVGFPTRWKVTAEELEDTLVGTRFIGTGFGAEASYSFIKSPQRAFSAILQTRLVHFFNRRWFPILPCNAKIQPGNVTDVFALVQYREEKHIVELGYDATFFTQQAALLATGKVDSPNFIRSSLYTSYTYVFPALIAKIPGTLGCGVNLSRGNLFKTRIATFWANISLLF